MLTTEQLQEKRAEYIRQLEENRRVNLQLEGAIIALNQLLTLDAEPPANDSGNEG